MADLGNGMLHPVLDMMNSLGCKSKSKVSLALQVYLDLSEVKAMWNPQAIYNSKLDLIYVTGNWSKNAETQDIVIPLSASASVSPEWLTEVQNELSADEEKKMITLAFVAGDSSICYYQAFEGLHPPDSPESVQKRRCREERRQCRASDMMQLAHNIIADMIDEETPQESKTPDHSPND